MRRRLPVDVDGRAEVVENLVECSESGIVAPAIHIGTLNIQRFLTKAFSDEFRDSGFAGAAGSSYNGRIGRFAVCDRLENARKMIDLGVAMLNFPRDEPGAENASIADHLCLIDWFSG
ncbi:hypothetical protein Harman_36360 [Haloarcula mannanilytica]|uniref:Uncharacterized protein n=1 Tax=Haloarcula mannanilytica TaxID=2509225 RepID=A0A4C2EMG7_9EURY|nr:hypothetical protein Harman_36360 [Haloarcula mannanilytica]